MSPVKDQPTVETPYRRCCRVETLERAGEVRRSLNRCLRRIVFVFLRSPPPDCLKSTPSASKKCPCAHPQMYARVHAKAVNDRAPTRNRTDHASNPLTFFFSNPPSKFINASCLLAWKPCCSYADVRTYRTCGESSERSSHHLLADHAFTSLAYWPFMTIRSRISSTFLIFHEPCVFVWTYVRTYAWREQRTIGSLYSNPPLKSFNASLIAWKPCAFARTHVRPCLL